MLRVQAETQRTRHSGAVILAVFSATSACDISRFDSQPRFSPRTTHNRRSSIAKSDMIWEIVHLIKRENAGADNQSKKNTKAVSRRHHVLVNHVPRFSMGPSEPESRSCSLALARCWCSLPGKRNIPRGFQIRGIGVHVPCVLFLADAQQGSWHTRAAHNVLQIHTGDTRENRMTRSLASAINVLTTKNMVRFVLLDQV